MSNITAIAGVLVTAAIVSGCQSHPGATAPDITGGLKTVQLDGGSTTPVSVEHVVKIKCPNTKVTLKLEGGLKWTSIRHTVRVSDESIEGLNASLGERESIGAISGIRCELDGDPNRVSVLVRIKQRIRGAGPKWMLRVMELNGSRAYYVE